MSPYDTKNPKFCTCMSEILTTGFSCEIYRCLRSTLTVDGDLEVNRLCSNRSIQATSNLTLGAPREPFHQPCMATNFFNFVSFAITLNY